MILAERNFGDNLRPMSEPLHLFIADDDADDRSFLIKAFDEHQNTIVNSVFVDGRHLLDYFQKDRILLVPHGIILDINMPLVNGFETLVELKKLAVTKTLPIFILSSTFDETQKAKCLKLGCTKFFTKPDSDKGYSDLAAEIIDNVSPS